VNYYSVGNNCPTKLQAERLHLELSRKA